VFGDGDELGTVNFLTPEAVRDAAHAVRSGDVVNLDYPLNAFVPSIAGTRPETRHSIFSNNPNHRDDWIDSFYLQSTSQVDGLRHIRHPEHGFYGGVPDDRIAVGTPDLGIHRLAERGIAGRGVLLDVQRHFAAVGRDYDVTGTVRITPDDLDAIAARQHVELRPGDILLLHFGWAEHYLAQSLEGRALMKGKPGLAQSEAILAWLWDHRIAMVAADNSGVEAIPVDPSSAWYDPDEPRPERGPSHNGLMHRQLIALLGVTLGELWRLHDLASLCHERDQYDFLVTVKPLDLVGGVGSPPNATAIL
jgi:kynurenine formamidase